LLVAALGSLRRSELCWATGGDPEAWADRTPRGLSLASEPALLADIELLWPSEASMPKKPDLPSRRDRQSAWASGRRPQRPEAVAEASAVEPELMGGTARTPAASAPSRAVDNPKTAPTQLKPPLAEKMVGGGQFASVAARDQRRRPVF